MKKIAGYVIQAIGILMAGLILGTVLLVAVYALPAAQVETNVETAAEIFAEEGDHPSLFSWTGTQLDNWTDAIMLLNARYNGTESSLEKAMLVPRRQSSLLDAMNTLIEEGGGRVADSDYFVASYSRYWHGYLIFLKPLLMLTNYAGIRIFNLIFQTALTISVLAVMWKKGLKYCMLPYAVTVLSIMPVDNAFSMQYADVTYLFSIGVLVLVLWGERQRRKEYNYVCYFISMGLMTSYFDFLTYPVVSFGIPMVIYLCINRIEGLRGIKKVISYGICWGYGYFGMWAGKWILATLLTGENVLREAQDSALYRIYGGGDMPVSGIGLSLGAIVQNAGVYLNSFNRIMLLAFVIAAIILLTKKRAWKRWLKLAPAFGLTAVIPFAWYIVIRSHSYVHCWMTYKDLGVTCIAFTGLCACVLAEEQEKKVK